MTMEDLERFRAILLERQSNVGEWLADQPNVNPLDLDKVRELLTDIQRALHQIEDQSYGHCAICGDPVELYRLEIQPVTEICLGCITEQERNILEEELTVAARIHRALLPQQIAPIDGFELSIKSLAARSVGGDYYDVLRNDNNSRVKIVIADSMGKGIPAGLLMSNLQGALRILSQDIESPSRLVSRLNHWLCRNVPVTKFVSLAVVDLPIGSSDNSPGLTANAGHCPGIIVRHDEQVECLEPTGAVLGVHEAFEYTEKEFQLSRGDLLALYTDGVTEAEDPDGDMFHVDRLTNLLVRHRKSPLDTLANRVLTEVQQFTGKITMEDDFTLILVRKV